MSSASISTLSLHSHAQHHQQQRDYTGRLRSSSGSGYRGQEAAYPGARSQSFLDLHHAEETDRDQELDRDRGWRQRSYGVSDADLERAARWELWTEDTRVMIIS